MFPNLTTGSVDLVVKAETSSHPKRPANHGVKGEVASINLRGGRSTTFLFKFVFIMAVWANLPFSLWPGMGMSAYFAYTIVGFKGQSNPVKKVMIAIAIESVIFIVMSSLDIRRMIFKIFPAWMMKATMAGFGMFLAFIGLQSDKGIDIIRDHFAVLDDLVEELENHFKLQKWLREFENTCECEAKIATLQLRACQKNRHHLALQKRDRTKTNLDNELATNFANDNLANLIFKKKLVALLLERHFALATFFQLYGNKAWKKLRVASNEISFGQLIGAKKLHQQLRREQLDCKDLRSASFRALCPSSFEHPSFSESTFEDQTFKEETFKEETFPEESFEDSSLEEETFSESSLEDSSFDKSSLEESSFDESSFDKHSFYKNNLEESSFDKSNFEESSFEQSSLRAHSFQDDSFHDKSSQRRTSTPELAQLERTALHTELSHLEQRALEKAASRLELSTAQLCGKLGLFLGGGSLHTSPRRGGVLRGKLALPSLPACLTAWPQLVAQALLRELPVQKGASPLSLALFDFAKTL